MGAPLATPPGGRTNVREDDALDAYRPDKLLLPPGYGPEYGTDTPLLRKGDGSVVAAFNTSRVTLSQRGKASRGGLQKTREKHRLAATQRRSVLVPPGTNFDS